MGNLKFIFFNTTTSTYNVKFEVRHAGLSHTTIFNQGLAMYEGKTAYYDPNNNTIGLYTTNRHSKDILRSYCHELIHLHQDREGRIPNIQTEDVNSDKVLLELEKEAYLMGNILMRKWENLIKNK